MKKFFLIIVALLIATGCGTNMFEGMEDKNTSEATSSEVSKKLNSGDYDWILNNPAKVNATDYAAAAMAKAGLNPTELIKALNNITDSGSLPKSTRPATLYKKNDLGTVTAISINTDALDELQTAKDKLKTELAANPGDPDLSFQLVLTSITSTLTALAKVGESNVLNFDLSDGIDSTEAIDLGNFIADNPGVQVDISGTDTPNLISLIDLVAEDVGNAVAALIDANLGGSDLDQVLTDITQGQGSLDYDGDGIVTSTDISDYFINVLGL